MAKWRQENYTVGWICALPTPEWKASMIMLDEEHEDVSLESTTQYQYTFGSINGHHVVMGCLPDSQLGTVSAASVASEMHLTFPSLRFVLLVGIGGGVPNEHNDIRLGDVVVSRPDKDKQHGGIIQYDFGKAVLDGRFQHTGMLNRPSDTLLSAIGKIRAMWPRNSKFYEYLDSYNKETKHAPEFSAQTTVDTLFKSSYGHPSRDPTCRKCDLQFEVKRPARSVLRPQIHYGTIASGNQVIKDGQRRDAMSTELGGVLCFEMEAAGLVSHFPCLVIRGICDYCDSHKNKTWQPYAVASAAAFAKEVLRNIPPVQSSFRYSDQHILERSM